MNDAVAKGTNSGAGVIELVQTLVEKLNQKEDVGEGGEDVIKEILQAKDERKELDAIKEALSHQIEDIYNTLTEEQNSRIHGLFNRMSPLLSFPTGILEIIVSYLDEESLWATECASVTLNDVASKKNWEYLELTHPHGKQLVETIDCRTRGRAYGRMAFHANLQEQQLAEALSYEEEELTKYKNRWLYFLIQPEKLESYSQVFLRLSHRKQPQDLYNNDRVVWQGFVLPTFLLDRNLEGSSTELVIEFHLQGTKIDRFREWIKNEMKKGDGKALLQKLELTILASDQLDAEPELVLTSRGFAHHALECLADSDLGKWEDRDPMKYSQLQVNASFTTDSGTDDLFVRVYQSFQPPTSERGSLFCVHF